MTEEKHREERQRGSTEDMTEETTENIPSRPTFSDTS